MSTKNIWVELACQLLGSQAELAKALKVTPPTVNQWVNGSRPVPIEACVAIEQATEGRVMRWNLRSSDWHRIWPELVGRVGAPEPINSDAQA